MSFKTVYLFNDSGAFAGVYNAQESPLEPGEFITPEKSTDIEPPTFTEAQTCHFVDGTWVVADKPIPTPEPTPTPEPVQITKYSPLDFIGLFTDAEQLAVVTASMQSPQIKLWYDKMLATPVVDITDARTIAGIDALVQAGLITQSRATEILTPKLVQS